MASTISMPQPLPSVYSVCNRACADVYMVPMFTDNYGYILVDRSTNLAVTVDPAEPEKVIQHVENLNLNYNSLLCTHKHSDHAGGNEFMKRRFPDLKIIATKYEPIPGVTEPAGDCDIFTVGNLKIETIYTPCHTKGHVCFLVTKNTNESIESIEDIPQQNIPILFCGDTLFVGGCGRFFEGTATEMLHNMDRLSQLPPETLVFCAHEYTQSNYNFLHSLDPINLKDKYESILRLRSENIPTVPSTIGEELRYNLFMRCHDSYVQDLVKQPGDPIGTMGTLRAMKNNFKG